VWLASLPMHVRRLLHLVCCQAGREHETAVSAWLLLTQDAASAAAAALHCLRPWPLLPVAALLNC